jgi:chorismate mutase
MSDAPEPDPLERARRAIDAVDDRLLALFAERAALAAEIAAAKGPQSGSPMRPAREIGMLRRLAAAAPASLDKGLVVELWRALISDNLRRQKPIEVFTGGAAGGADQLRLFDLARRHFGAGVRITPLPDPRTALTRMVETPAAAAVLPFPGRAGAGLWWPMLSERKFHEAVIATVLPMAGDGAEPQAALLTMGAPLEEAGGDTTLAFAQDPHFKLVRGLNEAKLQGREMARAATAVLIQLDGYVGPGDPRLAQLTRAGLDGLRVVGCFARV